MSSNFKPPKLLSQVTSRAAISLPVALLTAFFSIQIHIFTSPDLDFSSLGIRSIAAGASVVPMLALVWVAFQIPTKSEVARIAIVYGSYIVGGGLRGITLALLLDAAGILPAGGLQFRVISGMLSMSFTIAILTYVWGSFSSYLLAIRTLSRENEELLLSLERIRQETGQQTEFQVSEISKEILSTLSALRVRSADEQISEIMSLINDKVRPLSKSLASETTAWGPALTKRPRGSIRKILAGLNFADNIPPIWLTLQLALAPLPIALYEFGPGSAVLVSVYAMAFLLPAAVGVKWIVRRVLPVGGQLAKITFLSLGYLLIGASGSFGTFVALLGSENPSAFVVPGILATFLFGWTVTLGLASWDALKKQQEELDALGQTLKWAVARANLLSSHNRRMLARFLHGPVQSSLHATAIRLRNEKSKTPKDQIFDDIRLRLFEAKPATWHFEEFQTRLWEIELLWEGLAEVTVEVSPEAEKLLASDSALASHTVELCSEQCSVAIRKFGATEISIVIRNDQSGQLEVSTIDNRDPGQADLESVGISEILFASSFEVRELSIPGRHEYSFMLPSSTSV